MHRRGFHGGEKGLPLILKSLFFFLITLIKKGKYNILKLMVEAWLIFPRRPR